MDALRPAVVCVFAKPVRPGEVKTRLIPTYGATMATELAGAFFADTWQSLAVLSWARPVVATTDTDPRYWESVPGSSLWEQGDGDLGERLQRIMRRGLQEADVAIAIGADTPGLPMRLLGEARDRLKSADAVLGPSDDGGFYLLALKQCPDRLFHDLVWSQATTFAATCARLEEHGMRVSVLDPWFDVDVPEDLQRLHRRIRRGEIVAPATAQVLAAQVFVDHGQTADFNEVP